MKLAYHIWTSIEQSPIDYVNTGFPSTGSSRDLSLLIVEKGIKI